MLIYLLITKLLMSQAAITLNGSWNSEWAVYNNVSLNDTTHSNKNYIIQEFILAPEIILNDNVSIKSNWYFVGALGKKDIQLNSDNIRFAQIYGGSNYGLSITPNQLYLDWKTDYFTLMAGRQSFKFGLGVFKNADEHTDVVDRVLFHFPFDTVYLKAGIDILQNPTINDVSDSYEALILEAGYKQDLENIEMAFLLYKTYMINSSTLYDLYLRKTFPVIGFDIQAETIYRKTASINAFAFATEINWEYSKFIANVKTGLTTGDSSETITSRTFKFSPSYQVALLMFQQDLGTGANIVTNLNGIGGSYSGLGAFYISPGLSYLWNKFVFNTTFTYGQTQKTPATHPSKVLGYEVDLNIAYNVYDNFTAYVKTGMLKPGTFFSGNDMAYAFLVGLETSF